MDPHRFVESAPLTGNGYDLGNYVSTPRSDDGIILIPNITNRFLKFLYKFRYWQELGFILRTDGAKGSGKTTSSLILAFIITAYNLIPPDRVLNTREEGWNKRTIGIWTSSETLVPTLIRKAPILFRDRIVQIKKMEDIKNWMVVVVDEGVNTFDAKEALTVENRETGKGSTILRHKSVIFMLNSVRSKGILAALRDDADIKLFKYCGTDYIQGAKDVIVREYGDFLKTLQKSEAFLFSNYAPLRTFFKSKSGDVAGALKFELTPEHPFHWLVDPEISLNMRGESLALETTKKTKINELYLQIAEDIADKFGSEAVLKKTKAVPFTREFIHRHWPEHRYLLKKSSHVQRICDILIYNSFLAGLEQKEVPNPPEIKQVVWPQDKKTFKVFMEDFYTKNLPDRIQLNPKNILEKDTVIAIFKDWLDGVGQRDLRMSYISQSKLTPLFKAFKTGTGIEMSFRLGFVYEAWIASITGAEHAGGIGEPDLWYTVKGKKYPGEVKFYDDTNKCKGIDARVKLKPSYDYCKEHDIPYFPVFCGNPKWDGLNYLYTYRMDGPYTLNLEAVETYLLGTFTPEDYYNTIGEVT